MKKILALLLVLGLMFTLVACTGEEEPPAPPTETPPMEEPYEPEEEELDLDMEEDPYEEEGFGQELRPTDGTPADIDTAANLAALGLTIMLINEENASEIPMVRYDFFYRFMQEARGENVPAAGTGHDLLITADVPLYDFSIIAITNEDIDDELAFIPVATLDQVDLLAGEGYHIIDFVAVGQMPFSAITFRTEDGQRFYFAIIQNQAYPEQGGAYILLQFANRTDELPADWVAPW